MSDIAEFYQGNAKTSVVQKPERKDILMKNVRGELLVITPKIAGELLSKNDGNRLVSRRTVQRYTKAMREGRWDVNGESIKVAHDGKLLDGQHRLQALIEADVSLPMMIIRGLPAEAFRTIDTGKMRNGADVIGMHDESLLSIQHILAPACRIIYHFDKHGHFRSVGKGMSRLDNNVILEVLEHNKGLARSVKFSYSLQGAAKFVPASAIGALHYLFSKKDINLAEEFFHKLDSGAELKADDPVFVLRKRLGDLREHYHRLDSSRIIPIVIKAWNHARAGDKVQRFNIPEDYDPVIE